MDIISNQIYVLKEYRSKGIGKNLFYLLIEDIKNKSIPVFQIENPTNDALPWYVHTLEQMVIDQKIKKFEVIKTNWKKILIDLY